jgi:hypothetical protein
MGAATEASPTFPLEKTAMKVMMGGLAFFLLIAAQVLAVIAVRSRFYRFPEESRTEVRGAPTLDSIERCMEKGRVERAFYLRSLLRRIRPA